jgi:hypothetical protein
MEEFITKVEKATLFVHGLCNVQTDKSIREAHSIHRQLVDRSNFLADHGMSCPDSSGMIRDMGILIDSVIDSANERLEGKKC